VKEHRKEVESIARALTIAEKKGSKHMQQICNNGSRLQ